MDIKDLNKTDLNEILSKGLMGVNFKIDVSTDNETASVEEIYCPTENEKDCAPHICTYTVTKENNPIKKCININTNKMFIEI